MTENAPCPNQTGGTNNRSVLTIIPSIIVYVYIYFE